MSRVIGVLVIGLIFLGYVPVKAQDITSEDDWIIFVSNATGDNEIYRVHPDGTMLENLTNNPADDGMWNDTPGLSVSPDRQWIYFISNRTEKFDMNIDIYRMRLDGSELTKLTDTPAIESFDNNFWSPDGEWLAFDRFDRGTGSDVYVMQADGSNQRAMFRTACDEFFSTWQPDTQRAVVYTNCDYDIDVYSVNVDGKLPLTLANDDGFQFFEAWGPDKTTYLVSSNADGDRDLFLGTLDSKELVRLTDLDGDEYGTGWSPDGEWIVFAGQTDNHYNFFRIRPDGSDLEQITNLKIAIMKLWWLENVIYFNAIAPTGHEAIFQAKLDGSDAVQITPDDYDGVFYTWASDSRIISYSEGDIYIMEPDGNNLSVIANTGGSIQKLIWIEALPEE